MPEQKRPIAYWVIVIFLIFLLASLAAGQTASVFDYEAAVDLGMQESANEIGEYGMEVNRSVGAADTAIFLPLVLLSLIGLTARRRWSLVTAAGAMGITAYASLTSMFMLSFLDGVPTYIFEPPSSYWIILSAVLAISIWAILYLIFRGGRLTTGR